MDEIKQLKEISDTFASELNQRIIVPLRLIIQIRNELEINAEIHITDWSQKTRLFGFRKPKSISAKLYSGSNRDYPYKRGFYISKNLTGISKRRILCNNEWTYLENFSHPELRLIADAVSDLVQQVLEQLSTEFTEFKAVNKVSDFALGNLESAAEAVRGMHTEPNEAS